MNNFLPLISVAAVKAALNPTAPTDVAETQIAPQVEAKPQETFLALVQSSKPAPEGGFILQALVDGQRFSLFSALALPKGTELILAPPAPLPTQSPSTSSAPLALAELSVIEIILPAPSPRSASESVPSSPSPSFIENTLKPFLMARLAILEHNLRPSEPADTYTKPSTALPPAQTATAPQEASAAKNSPALNNASIVAHLLNTHLNTHSSTPYPKAVQQILQQWQQQLPSSDQLSQAPILKQHLQQSGLSYEKHLYEALAPLLRSEPQHPASALFKQLVARHFAPLPSLADSLSAASATTRIGQILQALKTQLEIPATSLPTAKADSTNTALLSRSGAPEPAQPSSASAHPPSLLNTLLSSDAKAVLSKALLAWTNSTLLPLHPQATPQLPELYQQLQKALSHIEHEQSQWLQQTQGQSNSPHWQLTIPLVFQHQQHPQELRIHIEKEEQESDNKHKKGKHILWRLRLYFELSELGPLDISLELMLPKIKAIFWSTQSDTLTQLNHHLRPLKKQLRELGAEVEELRVQYGQLPEPERNKINHHWVDIHG